MELTTRELARLIELKRKKAELELEQSKGSNVDQEILAITSNLKSLEERTNELGVSVLIPFEKQIAELTGGLKAIPRDDLVAATKTRNGALFELLKQRTFLIKRNLENRLEIAKLSIIATHLPQDSRSSLTKMVQEGRIVSELPVDNLVDSEKILLSSVLRRCGIPCALSGNAIAPADSLETHELSIELGGKVIWVNSDKISDLRENLKKIPSINARIQLKNAERQIRSFNPEEEKEFEDLQNNYLSLLKEQEQILQQYDDEEKLKISKEEQTSPTPKPTEPA